jgi:hypothetical protein
MTRTCLAICWLVLLVPLLAFGHDRSGGENTGAMPVAGAARRTPAELDPAKSADIQRLLEITGNKKMVMDSMREMTRQTREFIQARFPSERGQQIFDRMMEKYNQRFERDYDWLMDQFGAVWAEHLTHEEIKGLIEFYQSPLGRKTLEVMPKMMAEFPRIFLPWIQEVSDEIRKEMEQEFPELRMPSAPSE